ncbi:MAG: hypothetical protein M3158_11050 [Pseudomonadota bacterium]|nr:hypothetical protein [Pseudomonadota bacterium]
MCFGPCGACSATSPLDDIAEGVVRVLDRRAWPDPALSAGDPGFATAGALHWVYTIGNDRPAEPTRLIVLIVSALGVRSQCLERPLLPGDVLETRACVTDLRP